MKYAREVMDLMAAYPGREFRMGEIVNYVKNGRELTVKERSAINVGVHRVLTQLADCGTIEVREQRTNGSFALYSWKP